MPPTGAPSRATTDGSDAVYKELEHVRLIHFTLLAVSGALIYLYLSVHLWSELPRVRAELDEFAAEWQATRAGRSEAGAALVDSDIEAAQRSVSQSAGRYVGWSSGATDAMRRVLAVRDPPGTDSTQSLPDLARVSLRLARSRLEQRGWERDAFERLETDTKAFQEFVDEPACSPLTRCIREVTLEGIDISGDEAERPRRATLLVRGRSCTALITRRDVQTGAPARLQCREDGAKFSGEVYVRRVPVFLPERWFERRFPALEHEWEELRVRTVDQARAALGKQEFGELLGKKASLLGLEIEGRHLGTIGPVAVVLCLFYLIAYVRQLQALAPIPFRGPSPWIVAAKDPVARALGAFTLALGPVAVFLCLRGFAGRGMVASALITVFPAALVVAVVASGGRLAGTTSRPAAAEELKPSA